MNARERFEAAHAAWKEAVALQDRAIEDFMDDGLQTSGGTWILTMNQAKAQALTVARHRVDHAKSALDRIVDDLQRTPGSQRSN